MPSEIPLGAPYSLYLGRAQGNGSVRGGENRGQDCV